MPKVSVIIPVHNAGAHLRQCLDSVLGQSLEDIEVLCVDDGSTDDSSEILSAYAENDSRLTFIGQKNAGAGAARNRGLQEARGEYLSFLDADDFLEPTAFEEIYAKCISEEADVCVFKVMYFHTHTGLSTPANAMLKTALLPEERPFSREDMPDHIFDFAANAAWNKVFRRAFVTEKGLRFQEIRRANDYVFTKLALVEADRISIVDRALVNYRIGAQSNLQSTNHELPLEFLKALRALKAALIESGIHSRFERGLVNEALENCLYNLKTLQTHEAFHELYSRLRNESFAELGIEGRSRDYFFVEARYDQYLKIMERSPEAYLFDEVGSLRCRLADRQNRLDAVSADNAKTKKTLKRIQESRSYRVGRRISAILRRIRGLSS